MPTFQGNLAKNPNACLLNIKNMNGRDSHTLRLQKGDMLRVRFEAERGTLKLEIHKKGNEDLTSVDPAPERKVEGI